MNKVFLQGNLTRASRLRYTQSGIPVADFGLAVNRKLTGPGGDIQEETCFVEVLCTAELASAMHPKLSKGSAVFLEGQLRAERWKSQQGPRSQLKVVVQTIEIVSDVASQATEQQGLGTSEKSE